MIHSPNLATILMVEKLLERKDEIGTYQLWKRLPRRMMYQTLQEILKYLEKSGKIYLNGARVRPIKKEEKPRLDEKPCPCYVT